MTKAEHMEETLDFEHFQRDNRYRVNHSLNRMLWFCILAGPAIALGVAGGVFKQTSYLACIILSCGMAVVAGSNRIILKKKRDGTLKIPHGSIVMTCFTSDFLLKDADQWRDECWEMIKSRDDCMFYFFTKRIERFPECVPADWGDGYDNVIVGCTCENQDRADFRLPIFAELPIKHKTVILGPKMFYSNTTKSGFVEEK